MSLLDWPSDGLPAILVLVMFAILLLFVTLRGSARQGDLSRYITLALAWHFGVWAFTAFWLLPHYAATSQADAIGYFADSMRNAAYVRSGEWQNISLSLGTDVIPFITGILFAPAGGDIYGILFFSAALGLSGSLYFCRAFGLWVSPDLLKRYTVVILFLPSFATWTSVFGKDSWVCLGLGLATYGYSLMLKARSSKGLWHLGAGIFITTAIRPHISLTLVASMALAYLWGLAQRGRGSFLTKAVMVTLLGAMSAGLLTVASKFIGVSDLTVTTVEEYAAQRSAANAGMGNSDVEVRAAPGVLGTLRAFPRGVIRVLFQPFPWEISGLNSGLAALENIFLLWYVINNARRLRGLVRGMAREPFLLFSSAISVLLLLMLSLTPNLGLISRQRAQLLPFVFALLVAARAARKSRIQPVSAVSVKEYRAGVSYPAAAQSVLRDATTR